MSFGTDAVASAKHDLLSASQSLASFADSLSGLLNIKTYVQRDEMVAFQSQISMQLQELKQQQTINQAQQLDFVKVLLEDHKRAQNQVEIRLSAAIESEGRSVEVRLKDVLAEEKRQQNDLAEEIRSRQEKLKVELDQLAVLVSGVRTELADTSGKLQMLIDNIRGNAEGLLGYDASRDNIENVIRLSFSALSDTSHKTKRLVSVIQEKASSREVQELSQRVTEMHVQQQSLIQATEQAASRVLTLSRTLEDTAGRVLNLDNHAVSGDFPTSLSGKGATIPPSPIRRPGTSGSSVDWSQQLSEAEDITVLRERIEQYISLLEEKVDKSDLENLQVMMRSDLTQKIDRPELDAMAKTLADFAHDADHSALSEENMESLVKVIQARISRDRIAPDDIIGQLETTPEVAKLTSQLHKILCGLLVKADRADVEEVTKRLTAGLGSVSAVGSKVEESLQAQVERLQMLLNFKVDKNDILSRLDRAKADFEGKIGLLEKSQRISYEKQMGKLMDNIHQVVDDLVVDKSLSEVQQRTAFQDVMGRSISRFTHSLAQHVGSEPVYRGQKLFGDKQFVVLQPSQWPYMYNSGPLVLKQGHPVRAASTSSPVRPQSTLHRAVPTPSIGDTTVETSPQCLVIGVDGQVYRGDTLARATPSQSQTGHRKSNSKSNGPTLVDPELTIAASGPPPSTDLDGSNVADIVQGILTNSNTTRS